MGDKHDSVDHTHDYTKMGSIKDIALFSKLALFNDMTDQKVKETYRHLHPKVIDLGIRIKNDDLISSNARCVAMIMCIREMIVVRSFLM